MKRHLLALALGVLVLLLVGAGTATAGLDPFQGTGQSAGSQQDAGSAAGTAQQGPTNQNTPIRVLSPGEAGSVEQSNDASSNATAGNANGTSQTADQSQAGGPGVQAVGQSATNGQDALALALTLQKDASNENMPVRVLDDGEDGSVSQSNEASSDATAGNVNGTEQTAGQDRAGAGGTQIVGQAAGNEQDAAALSATVQESPSNTNGPVGVLSSGDGGSVEQSNEATSNATAGNLNGTTQTADQAQRGGPSPCGCGSKSPGAPGSQPTADICGCPVAGAQIVGQSADNAQEAGAVAFTEQSGASNENISVRVLSPGNNGSVTQSNVASSNAAAGNANGTHQTADQTQAGGSCKCGAGTQLIGQSASNAQAAAAFSATIQEKPSNSNIPIRVLSEGDDGDVTQSNVATSNATAANLNGTAQSANQSQAGGSGIQVIGQESSSGQLAIAAALTAQLGASNENAPVRVLSHGNGGSVSQSNTASSNANAGNANRTGQNAVQEQGGRHDGCCGKGIQAIGQSSQNWQAAKSVALTLQLGIEQPCRCGHGSEIGNSNSPTRVLSQGDDGSVRQSNNASSNAQAANWNATTQAADQLQNRPDSCRCKAGTGIQAIGQLDTSSQAAAALAASLQLGAENEWAPDRKSSPGNWGGLFQNERNAAHDLSGSRSATDQSRSQGRG